MFCEALSPLLGMVDADDIMTAVSVLLLVVVFVFPFNFLFGELVVNLSLERK
jgi:ABC-type sulfate transport system permease subunit